MQLIVLSIHLLVSICLIGLVLLQRSEGGALGIGGGGGGSLMSGRGASDALARMTSIAGGLFLAVSLALTWLSGAGQGEVGGVIDFSRPAIEQPEAPATPPPTEAPRPDPTESSAPQAADTALAAILPGPGDAAASTPNSARAAPLDERPQPSQVAAATPQRTAPGTAAGPAPARTTPAAATTPPRTQPASTAPERTPQPLAPEVTGEGVSGVSLTEPTTPESVSVGQGMEAVRRERAGPDQ